MGELKISGAEERELLTWVATTGVVVGFTIVVAILGVVMGGIVVGEVVEGGIASNRVATGWVVTKVLKGGVMAAGVGETTGTLAKGEDIMGVVACSVLVVGGVTVVMGRDVTV
ncbi:hypothetical protein KI387_017973, partial [Taxus chinensis]